MKYVGIKQVTRVAKSGKAKKVYIAKDAEQEVVQDLINACTVNNIDVVYVDTMKELGNLAGIDVEAATAAE